MPKKPSTLGVGIIGGGFIARFHIRSWVGVRDADILGVFDPDAKRAREACALVKSLGVGDARPFASITAMAADPRIGALWICAPNYTRGEVMEEIAPRRRLGPGRARRRRLRKAPRPQRPRGPEDARARPEGRPARRLPREPGLLPGRRPRQGDRLGPRRGPRPARPISPGPPRSTAARTCPGSGKARSRAAASSTT